MTFFEKLKAVFTGTVHDTSKPGTLNSTDYAKITRDFIIVSASAGCAYLANNLHLLDLGQYTPVLVPVIAMGLQTLIKWLKSNSPEQVG